MPGAGYAAGPDTAARVTSVPPCTGAANADCYNYIAGIILNITFCTLHNIQYIHRTMVLWFPILTHHHTLLVTESF